MIVIPALVVLTGAGVLLLGMNATREASHSMARDQLATQATDIARGIDHALDQAAPILMRLATLADPALALPEVAPRLHDLHVGRAGVTTVSIAFASGRVRATSLEQQDVHVEESTTNVRELPAWKHAIEHRARSWMPPRASMTSTSITCVEPILVGGEVAAVLAVDFDIAALADLVVRTPMKGAHSVIFAKDHTVLWRDADDDGLAEIFAQLGSRPVTRLSFITVGRYLASVSPLAGTRANAEAPLDWYLATMVPRRALLGPSRRLQAQSLVASAAGVLFAVAIGLVFAWNLARMRRQVGAAREAARDAEARASDLGSYRLVEKLGAGGMGEVWRAEHRLLARHAAVKLVRSDTLKDPVRALKVRERFRREAQTLAGLRSRHTIQLFDYGVSDDGTFFYVMELLEGLDLDKYVRQYGAMPAARVIDVLAQACASLAEAHDAGLLHRDIKPGNLFLTRAADEVDIIKLLDFGIVRSFAERDADPLDAVTLPTVEERMARAQRLTKIGAVVGTCGYIAPEQTDGKDTDGRSDLYALGCVAWWLLSASEVYARNPDEMETLRAHCEEPVPALRVKGWMPAALDELVRALLAKRPEDRPANARAVAAALRAIEIPAEHAWTAARAEAWWLAYQSIPTPTAQAAEKRLLVSDRERKPQSV